MLNLPFGAPPELLIDVSSSPLRAHFQLHPGTSTLPAEVENLPEAMCLALARSNQKYLNNKKPKPLTESQHTHHFFALTPMGAAWLCSLIFAEAVHIQSLLLSDKHLQHGHLPEDQLTEEDRERLQIDHLTGEWSDTGLGCLHLTSVRDFKIHYQAGAKYLREEQVLEAIPNREPVLNNGKNCPQQFATFRFTEESMRRCVESTKYRTIGTSGPTLRSTLSFSITLPDAVDVNETVSALNANLRNTHHVIDLTKQAAPWPVNGGFELICRAGFLGDCLTSPSKHSDKDCLCEELTYIFHVSK